MYHPYFRGKQFELLCVREMAPIFKQAGFCPIIEPVRDILGGLNRALDAVVELDGRAIVIVNPRHGDLSDSGAPLSDLLKKKYLDMPGISAGILLKNDVTAAQAMKCYRDHASHSPVLIHSDFGEGKALAEKLGKQSEDQCHIFDEKYCGKLYQRHFAGGHRVLVRDGFERKKNREYEPLEPFSDLHATFRDEGMQGFGDFLVVGDDFSETGGPAYAVAIHLTFIDPDQDDSMWIHHFVSVRQDTPKDPAGKFAEALEKMMKFLDRPKSKILETAAVKEFRDLHRQGHFPGLGYIKKLSMNHHIETLADYFEKTA
ncbi:MAG: sce7725 family protein [Acidobacteriaceae bacterium]